MRSRIATLYSPATPPTRFHLLVFSVPSLPEAQIQPRLLIEEADGCYGDPEQDNMLIAGENLFVLKTLLRSRYAQQIRLVYIDPPYNTGNAFSHYDDGIEHSLWLTMMRDRLRLLRDLLRPDGSIWVHLDDAEAHYCRVLMDEIFGRSCFIDDIAWKKRDGPPNDRKIGSIHEHILIYSRERGAAAKATVAELGFNLMPRTDKANAEYQVWPEPNGPDERGPFRKFVAHHYDQTRRSSGVRGATPQNRTSCVSSFRKQYSRVKSAMTPCCSLPSRSKPSRSIASALNPSCRQIAIMRASAFSRASTGMSMRSA